MYDVGMDECVKLRATVSVYKYCARLYSRINVLVLLRNVETSMIERMMERVNKNVSRLQLHTL